MGAKLGNQFLGLRRLAPSTVHVSTPYWPGGFPTNERASCGLKPRRINSFQGCIFAPEAVRHIRCSLRVPDTSPTADLNIFLSALNLQTSYAYRRCASKEKLGGFLRSSKFFFSALARCGCSRVHFWDQLTELTPGFWVFGLSGFRGRLGRVVGWFAKQAYGAQMVVGGLKRHAKHQLTFLHLSLSSYLPTPQCSQKVEKSRSEMTKTKAGRVTSKPPPFKSELRSGHNNALSSQKPSHVVATRAKRAEKFVNKHERAKTGRTCEENPEIMPEPAENVKIEQKMSKIPIWWQNSCDLMQNRPRRAV